MELLRPYMAGTRNLADRNHTETLTHQKFDVETDTRYFYGPKPELAKPSKNIETDTKPRPSMSIFNVTSHSDGFMKRTFPVELLEGSERTDIFTSVDGALDNLREN